MLDELLSLKAANIVLLETVVDLSEFDRCVECFVILELEAAFCPPLELPHPAKNIALRRIKVVNIFCFNISPPIHDFSISLIQVNPTILAATLLVSSSIIKTIELNFSIVERN